MDRELAAIEWARRQRGRRPVQGRSIRQVVARLVTDKNYAAVQARGELVAAWREAAGSDLASYSLPGEIRKGTLHVVVEDSTAMQELMFRQAEIVQRLQERLSGTKITRLRCRTGRVR